MVTITHAQSLDILRGGVVIFGPDYYCIFITMSSRNKWLFSNLVQSQGLPSSQYYAVLAFGT